MQERFTQMLLGAVSVLLLVTLLRPIVSENLLQGQEKPSRAAAAPSLFAASDHSVYVMRGNVLSVYMIDSGITNPFEAMALLDPEKKEEFIRKMIKNAKVRLFVEQDLNELRVEK